MYGDQSSKTTIEYQTVKNGEQRQEADSWVRKKCKTDRKKQDKATK
jgi:hypothetical protein